MENTELWTRYRAAPDDLDARNALVCAYQWVAAQVAQSMGRVMSREQREDALSEASLGLIRAVQEWDPAKTPDWLQYLRWKCRIQIVNSLRASGWVSKSTRSHAKKLAEAEEALTAVHGRKPTEEEVAANLGLDVDALAALRSNAGATSWQVASLDACPPGESVPAFHDTLANDEAGPEELALNSETLEQLRGILQRLSPVHRAVLERRYLSGERGMDIAADMGHHPSRTSQLEKEALREARALAHRRILP